MGCEITQQIENFSSRLGEANYPYIDIMVFNQGLKGHGFRRYFSYYWRGNQISLVVARQKFWSGVRSGHQSVWNCIRESIVQEEQEALRSLSKMGVRMYKGFLMFSEDEEGNQYLVPNLIFVKSLNFVDRVNTKGKKSIYGNKRPLHCSKKKLQQFMGNAQSEESRRDFSKMIAQINEPYIDKFIFNSGIKGFGYRKYVSYDWYGNQISLAHARESFWDKPKQGSPEKWNAIKQAITQDQQQGLHNLKGAGIKMYKGMLMLSQDQEGVKYHLPNFIYGNPQAFVGENQIIKTNFVHSDRPHQTQPLNNATPPPTRQSHFNVVEKQPLLPKQDQQWKGTKADEKIHEHPKKQEVKPYWAIKEQAKKPEQHVKPPVYHQVKKLQETYKPFVQQQPKLPEQVKPHAPQTKDQFKPVVFQEAKKTDDQAKPALFSQPKKAEQAKSSFQSYTKKTEEQPLIHKYQQKPKEQPLTHKYQQKSKEQPLTHKYQQKSKESYSQITKHQHEQRPKYIPPTYGQTSRQSASNSVFIVKSSNNLGQFKSSNLQTGSGTSLPLQSQFSFVSKQREKAEQEINNIITKQNVNVRGQEKNCMFCF